MTDTPTAYQGPVGPSPDPDPMPTGQTHRADLREFASMMAARIPGWTARTHDLARAEQHREVDERVWDDGTLSHAFEHDVPHEAAVLTGPGGAQFVALHRPGTRGQFLVGALRPAFIPAHLVDPDDSPVPPAITVGTDPVRAAAEVRRRLLPRYEQAVWRARVRALAAAADGITQASDAWDAVSDSFCDEDGWPADETGYANGKVRRDAAAWEHVETFLTHGPEVLAGVRAAVTGADYLDGPISNDLHRLRGIDTVLARAQQIRHEWEQVTALLTASPPGTREIYAERAMELRNSEGWHYADELSYSGRALAGAAEYLTDRIGVEQPELSPRVHAALTRSAPGLPSTGPALPPPSTPSVSTAAPRTR